jgi:hypothetical protein
MTCGVLSGLWSVIDVSSLWVWSVRVPGLTASLVYRAYAERILLGQDPLLLDEEARLQEVLIRW